MTSSTGTPQATCPPAGQGVSAATAPNREPSAPVVSADDYHADRFHDGPPSLSASLAHTLITKSPLHAKAQHPRLNPDYEREEDPKFDLGRVAHQVLLEGNRNIVVVSEDSWRTKAAQTARNEAWRVHMTALLEKDWERVLEMVSSVQEQLAGLNIDPIPFTIGRPEVTLTWSEPNGVRCKMRADWIHDGNAVVCDLKTSKVQPRRWIDRTIYENGYDLQAAFYLRGIRAVYGVDAEWRWVVAEIEPPYELTVVAPEAAVIAIGAAKVDYAVQKWGECLAVGEWPGWPKFVLAELPAYEEARWLEREAREEMAA